MCRAGPIKRESAMDAKEAFRKLTDIANGPLPTTKKAVGRLVGQITEAREAFEKERDDLQERVDDLTNTLEELESATEEFEDAEPSDREEMFESLTEAIYAIDPPD